nr:visual system homeobox 1-like; partial [Biomphalaria glabrata]
MVRHSLPLPDRSQLQNRKTDQSGANWIPNSDVNSAQRRLADAAAQEAVKGPEALHHQLEVSLQVTDKVTDEVMGQSQGHQQIHADTLDTC